MDPKDLLELLDLDGDPPDSVDASGVLKPDAGVTDEGVNATALDVDAWGLRRGRDLVVESDRLRAANVGESAAADFFWAAFDPAPTLLPGCEDPRRRAFLAELFDAPAYRALHADTRLDDTASAIAAAHFADQFAELAKGRDAAGASADAEATGGLDALRAAGRALAGAAAGVGELRDACAAFGLGPGESGSNDPSTVAALFRRVRGDPVLAQVCEHAGRLRSLARGRQRRKVATGVDDTVGVGPGGDLGRLLPVELARLADPDFAPDALRRLAERQSLCRELGGVERVGKGPVVVTVDESGSMQGGKVEAAKALALALAWVARRQKRWCGLVAYSGDSGERLLALPPGRWDESRLADWVCGFLGRGSTLDVPVRELPRMLADLGAPRGVTDVVMVTDAECRIPEADRDRFLAWKRSSRARVVALVLGASPGDLALICDECQPVADLTAEDPAVGRVLSV